MQQISNEDRPADSGTDHSNKGSRLTKRDVIGGAVMVIVFAGALSGYYVYNYITKDSARMQFWVSFMFSFAALVVVAIQATIYWQQTRFMKQQAKTVNKQLKLSRQAMRYSEAAYITVYRAEITKRLVIGQVTAAGIEFINSGNTPAYDVRCFLHFGIRPEGFMFSREAVIAIPGTVSTAVIGGHGATLKQTVHSNSVVTQEVLDEIGKDNQYIHVWGVVLYKDVFKRNRWTRFSLMLSDYLTSTLFDAAPTCNDAGGED